VRAAVDVFERAASDPTAELFNTARERSLLPYFRPAGSAVAPRVEVDGEPRLMLASANYLGLADHPAVIAGARDALERYGGSTTGSRLLNGTLDLHEELEAEIADWLQTEDALVFSTGYQANVGAISALVGPGDTVVVDSSDHASIIDGSVLSRAKMRAFKHDRLDLLEETLDLAVRDGGGVLVVVDGVFSMSGGVARVPEIARLCAERGARLLVDEAHGTGVLGERGTGASELFGVEDRVDLRMGALSKALGAAGGFIAGPRPVIDYLRVTARALLFTTSGVPAALGAALAAVRLRRSEEGRERAAATLANAIFFRDALERAGFSVPPLVDVPSGERLVPPIVPVFVGDDATAITMWRDLYDNGIHTSVALYPAVARGRALLRSCVMATHAREDLERAVGAFERAAAAPVNPELERV
jgi:8-amino-7-oxononanoate synthase